MPRRRGHGSALSIEQARELRFELCVGPVEWELRRIAATDAQAFEVLEAAWRLVSEELVAEFRRTQPGSRPWGWWQFDIEEERPSFSGDGAMAELARLVELGEVVEPEIGAIFARADAKLRVHGETFPHGLPSAVAEAAALDRLLGRARIRRPGYDPLAEIAK